VEGRITLEELEERLEDAISATTVADLADSVRDLPALPALAGAAEPVRLRARTPGVLRFNDRRVLAVPRGRAREVVFTGVCPVLNAFGYKLVDLSPSGFVFERQAHRSPFVLIPAILFFPIGLITLAFTGGATVRVVVSLERHGTDETLMSVNGAAPRPVRRAFADLTFK
jgi:hypothetical protein